MKIQIVDCLSEMVKQRFGKEQWAKILELSGMGKGSNSFRFFHGFDILDEKVFGILQNTCKVLEITAEQAADAFGDYWINVYAPRVFPQYYEGIRSAKDFILQMNRIHEEVTENIENARPPEFDFVQLDENRIKVHYKSKRKMIIFYIGLVKGLGIYFKTDIEVKQLSDEYVEIEFKD